MDRDTATVAVGVALALATVALLAGSVPLGDDVNGSPSPGEGDPSDQPEQPAGDTVLDFPIPSGLLRWLFAAGVAVAFAGAVLGVYRLRSGRGRGPDSGTGADQPDSPLDPDGPEESDVPAPDAAREAADRAADRIAEPEVDLENEVYRAWYEMTRALGDRDPRSATPGRFAALAIHAGMDASAVTELTRLFEDVRYGSDAPTAADEERAVVLLRQLSRTEDEEGDGEAEAVEGGDGEAEAVEEGEFEEEAVENSADEQGKSDQGDGS